METPEIEADNDQSKDRDIESDHVENSESEEEPETKPTDIDESEIDPEVLVKINDLKKKVRNVIEERKDNIEVIKGFANSINERHYRACATKVGGATTASIGSIIAVVGFFLSFETFGASLVVSVPGAILSGVGALTMTGADLGDFLFITATKKHIKNIMKREREKLQEIDELMKQLNIEMKSLAESYPNISKQKWKWWIKKTSKSLKEIYKPYKIVQPIIDAVDTVKKPARAIWPTLTLGGKAASTATTVLNFVSIPHDVVVLVDSLKKVYRYHIKRTKRISKTAQKIDELVAELERGEETLLKYYREVGGEDLDLNKN